MIRAIVIGGAACTWNEVELAKRLCKFDMVVVINRAGSDYNGIIHHWVSYHPENFPEWESERFDDYPTDYVKWSSPEKFGKEHADQLRPYIGGSSGLLACDVAIHMGADKVVLCGVPMDQLQPHYHDRSAWGNKNWEEAYLYRPHWEAAMPLIKDKVRSFSGWTMRHLGAPTVEWVNAC